MTRSTWRAWQAVTVDELTPHTGLGTACELDGRSRATHHRQAHPKSKVFGTYPKPKHPAELSPEERERILAVLNSNDYANSSVAQVWACELDEGRYWCSQRTMYRILAAAGQGGERRRQATHPPRAIPELVAEAHNVVWSWDTYVRTWAGFVYVAFILDVYSRRIVSWHACTSKQTDSVMTPLKMAFGQREREGHAVTSGWLLHHSDAGSQYTSIRLTRHLDVEKIAASIGSVGDAYDNALMEAYSAGL